MKDKSSCFTWECKFFLYQNMVVSCQYFIQKIFFNDWQLFVLIFWVIWNRYIKIKKKKRLSKTNHSKVFQCELLLDNISLDLLWIENYLLTGYNVKIIAINFQCFWVVEWNKIVIVNVSSRQLLCALFFFGRQFLWGLLKILQYIKNPWDYGNASINSHKLLPGLRKSCT